MYKRQELSIKECDPLIEFSTLATTKKVMATEEPVNTLKKLLNHYRLVIMNEDTYEEVVKFKLNRMSVDIACLLYTSRGV